MNFKNHVLKPIFASGIMGVIVYFAYELLINSMGNAISTIISIFIGAIIYLILVLLAKVLKKEDIYMVPFGTKIYSVLLKFKIYKEEN